LVATPDWLRYVPLLDFAWSFLLIFHGAFYFNLLDIPFMLLLFLVRLLTAASSRFVQVAASIRRPVAAIPYFREPRLSTLFLAFPGSLAGVRSAGRNKRRDLS
jgi:hypothetical protein